MINIRAAVLEPEPNLSILLPHIYEGIETKSFVSLMDFSEMHEVRNFEAVILEESDDFGNDLIHADYVKNHFPYVPLIMVARNSQSDLAIAGRLLDVFAVLARPFSKKDLELVLVGAKVKSSLLKPNAATDILDVIPNASISNQQRGAIIS